MLQVFHRKSLGSGDISDAIAFTNNVEITYNLALVTHRLSNAIYDQNCILGCKLVKAYGRNRQFITCGKQHNKQTCYLTLGNNRRLTLRSRPEWVAHPPPILLVNECIFFQLDLASPPNRSPYSTQLRSFIHHDGIVR
jgi:hypothetical protein